MYINGLNGLILVGGKSTRMGAAKHTLQYQQGVKQIDYLQNILTPFCRKVFISCRKDQKHDFACFPNTIIDNYTNIGPLSGLISAMESRPNTSWILVACDMPMLRRNHVQEIITNRDQTKLATCYINTENGDPEPLFTIYEATIFQLLQTCLATKKYSLKYLLEQEKNIHYLSALDSKIFLNINTIEAFNKFQNDKQKS